MTWIDVPQPSSAVLHDVAQDFGIPVDRILAAAERPKVESHGGATLLVLQLPLLESCEGELVTHELRLLLGAECLATLHDGTMPAITDLRERLTAEAEQLSPSETLELVLNAIVDTRLELVDMLTAETGRLESEVFETDGKRDHIRDVMRLRRHASTLKRIIATQLDLFESLAGELSQAPSYRQAFVRVLRGVRHLQVLVEGLQDRAAIVADANEAFIGHSLNSTLKVLTVFSVIMIPPTLIAGLFGTNVPVPFQESSWGFLWIVVGMAVIALGFVGYLRHKQLL